MQMRAIARGWLIAAALLGFIFAAASAVQAQDTTVVSLAADLAAATTEADIATLVADAQTAGLTDQQIAEAFGRASVTTTNPTVLAAAFSTFKSASSVAEETLDASYDTGVTAGGATGGDGGGGGGDQDSNLRAPSGGSGGGGGSENE